MSFFARLSDSQEKIENKINNASNDLKIILNIFNWFL
tara:strand:- start:304 stop:414 length:111 start_codon:yes stop_codon:yes gene_type:complete